MEPLQPWPLAAATVPQLLSSGVRLLLLQCQWLLSGALLLRWAQWEACSLCHLAAVLQAGLVTRGLALELSGTLLSLSGKPSTHLTQQQPAMRE